MACWIRTSACTASGRSTRITRGPSRRGWSGATCEGEPLAVHSLSIDKSRSSTPSPATTSTASEIVQCAAQNSRAAAALSFSTDERVPIVGRDDRDPTGHSARAAAISARDDPRWLVWAREARAASI